ncbi:MAG TPA: thiamine-phosphate kinase [Blastocatellia bacterium]|nr:thiamine-phosphate kinase [Blastocatellia bacterium]
MPKESEIISLVRRLARPTDRVPVGIGDDAAVARLTAATDLIACSDLSVEGVHFRIEWSDAWLIGRKSLAVTLSDIAAMGAEARFALISVALPAALSSEFIDQLFQGFFDIANSYGVSIIGGDTSGSAQGLFIDTVVIGEAKSGRAVTRAGARARDLIYVTGKLGASALGLSLLEQGRRLNESGDRAQRDAMMKHLNPEPRLGAGKAVGDAAIATSMIDISDGLSTDLSHILDESRCGAIIHAADIPVAESVRMLSPDRALEFALHGGEEYELLFTCQVDSRERVEKLSNELSIPITLIGEITAGTDLQLERGGVLESLKPSGYEHLL